LQAAGAGIAVAVVVVLSAVNSTDALQRQSVLPTLTLAIVGVFAARAGFARNVVQGLAVGGLTASFLVWPFWAAVVVVYALVAEGEIDRGMLLRLLGATSLIMPALAIGMLAGFCGALGTMGPRDPGK
jgi:hypothetical protein